MITRELMVTMKWTLLTAGVVSVLYGLAGVILVGDPEGVWSVVAGIAALLAHEAWYREF